MPNIYKMALRLLMYFLWLIMLVCTFMLGAAFADMVYFAADALFPLGYDRLHWHVEIVSGLLSIVIGIVLYLRMPAGKPEPDRIEQNG